MKLFKSNVLHVIIVPIAIAATQTDGCSSTPETGPLAAEAAKEVLVGNTVTLKGGQPMAFVAEDGSMRGRDLVNGGTKGSWTISSNGVLCVNWVDAKKDGEGCDMLKYLGDGDYEWNGVTLQIQEGNPEKI